MEIKLAASGEEAMKKVICQMYLNSDFDLHQIWAGKNDLAQRAKTSMNKAMF